MQKISSYLYPNRVQLLADLAGFTTEYTNVYQKIVKIYRGVDNVIEFDIKNADQKRLELLTDPVISNIQLNVLDASNYLVGSYVADCATGIKGIARVVIPASDVAGLNHQFLKYSVTATDTDDNTIPLYGDTRFGALGTIELVGDVAPASKPIQTFTHYSGEINLLGEVIKHTPAIPTTFYEAIPATEMNIHAYIEDFIGKIYVQGTTSSTITVESWKNAPKIMEFTYSEPTTTVVHIHPLIIGDYKYFRVSWENSDRHRISATNTEGLAGSVTKVTADIGPGDC